MKYSYTLPLLVAAVYAQDPPVNPIDEVSGTYRPYAQSVATINGSVVALDSAVLNFRGFEQAEALLSASRSVYTITEEEAIKLPSLPQVDENDFTGQVQLQAYVASLTYHINLTVFDLNLKKVDLVDACVGPVVLDQISSQSSAAEVYATAFVNHLPASLQPIGSQLASPIPIILASAISDFADQTTLPASCTATTTGGAAPTTTGETDQTTTAGNGWEVYTTAGPYPTASTYPDNGGDDDCPPEEEQPTPGYGWSAIPGESPSSTGDYQPILTYPGQPSSTGDYQPVLTYPTGGEWQPVESIPAGGDYTNAPPPPPAPTGGAVWSPVAGTPGVAPIATPPAPVATYTGAAATTSVNKFAGVAALAMLAVAFL